MSILVPFNGVNYIIPTPGETGWGSNLDSFFVAIGAGCLQKIGGSFLLASEVDFGASFGLKSLYFKTRSSNPASTGQFRLANADAGIVWRNAANNADLPLTVNASNQLVFNSIPITPDSFTASRAIVSDSGGLLVAATTTSTEIGYVNGVTSAIQPQLDSKAPLITPSFTGPVNISYNGPGLFSFTTSGSSNNDLGASITNTSAGTAAAAFLNVSNGGTSMTFAQFGANYSGSRLGIPVANFAELRGGSSGFVWDMVNGPIYIGTNGTLALTIDFSQVLTFANAPIFNSLTVNTVPYLNGSKVITSSAVTPTELGYVSGVTSSIQTQLNGKVSTTLTSAHIYVGNASNIATNVAMSGDVFIDNTGLTTIQSGVVTSAKIASQTIVNSNISLSAAIAYSKLTLTNSIVNADINSAAAIAYSKLTLTNSIVNADVNSAAAIVRSKLASTETTDITYASSKGIFWTDNTTNTIKIAAPASVTTYTMTWPSAQGGANQYLTNNGSGVLSWTNAAGTGTVNSGTQFQLAYYATSTNAVSGLTLITASKALVSDTNGLPVAATTTTTELQAIHSLTISRALQSDGSGLISVSATTATELGFVSGVTSAIQTQINTKAPTSSPTFTGTITAPTGSSGTPALNFGTAGTGFFGVGGSGSAGIGASVGGTNIVDVLATGFFPVADLTYNNGAAGNAWASVGTARVTNAAGVKISGTNTNDNATAGDVGQTVSSAVTGVSYPTSTNYGDLTSISLTAGDWLVSGIANTIVGVSTTTASNLGISTTTGNSATGLTSGDNLATQSIDNGSTVEGIHSLSVPSYRMSLSTTTTVYLKFRATYSAGTPSADGRISAVRIR